MTPNQYQPVYHIALRVWKKKRIFVLWKYLYYRISYIDNDDTAKYIKRKQNK